MSFIGERQIERLERVWAVPLENVCTRYLNKYKIQNAWSWIFWSWTNSLIHVASDHYSNDGRYILDVYTEPCQLKYKFEKYMCIIVNPLTNMYIYTLCQRMGSMF